MSLNVNNTMLSSTQSNDEIISDPLNKLSSSLFPICKKISAISLGNSLVSVKPSDILSKDEMDKIKREVLVINRKRKIISVLDKSIVFEEFKEEEHELYKNGKLRQPNLYYIDFKYNSPSNNKKGLI